MTNEIPITMTFREQFEYNIKNEHGKKPNENVFFMTHPSHHNGIMDSYTIEELLTTWGVHRHYDRVVERMIALTTDPDTKKPHQDRMVVVQYDSGDLDVNHNEQKLLYYIVSHNDGTFVSNGGALFQHGELTFHTWGTQKQWMINHYSI